ncbi:hypothetical protein [Vagococcus carniphilus]|uniref:hypothetical protein n=1 Tax=Vagococcus carniphilus TaxID=218144 RepID=UPI003BABEE92
MKKKILLLLILLPSFILLIQPIRTLGEELPPGMVVGDEKGIHANKDGEYFVKVDDVEPGKSWHKSISLLNMEKDVPYQLTMLISPPKVSGSLDLSKAIKMKLTYEGKVIYDGPASGVSKSVNLQNKPLDLGVFSSGDSRALEVDYSISGKYTMDDFELKNKMSNVWTFYAVKSKDPVKPKPKTTGGVIKSIGRLPLTGETVRKAMIFLCIGMLVILICLLIWKKRNRVNVDGNGGE